MYTVIIIQKKSAHKEYWESIFVMSSLTEQTLSHSIHPGLGPVVSALEIEILVIMDTYTVGTISLRILHTGGWGTEWPRDLSKVTQLGSSRAKFNSILALHLECLATKLYIFSGDSLLERVWPGHSRPLASIQNEWSESLLADVMGSRTMIWWWKSP